MQNQTADFIQKMKAQEFNDLQIKRTSRVMNIFENFIINTILAQQKEKEGCKEIGNILKKELQQIIKNHEDYIQNQEQNLQKINYFQNKEVILVNDFYEGAKMILDTYNYMYKEMGSFGKTRPTQENYIKSIQQFKGFLSVEEKNKKAYKLITDLEGTLKSQFEKLENQEMYINNLKQENEKLTQLYKQYQLEKQQWSIQKLKFNKEEIDNKELDDEDSIFNKYGVSKKSQDKDINSVHIRALEEFHINSIKKIKQENQRLTEQLFLANKKITAFSESSNKSQNQKSETEQQKTEKIKKIHQQLYTQEIGVQCSFISDKNPVTKRDNNFSNILKNPNPFLKFAKLQNKEWAQYLITLMYQDKLHEEINSEQDKRPKLKFQQFSALWFLKKFGNKDIAETFLKDFLLTLKKFGKQIDRFLLFTEFCDLEELIDPDFDSQSISSIGLCGNQNQIYNYSTLIPNVFQRGKDLISFENFQKILEYLTLETQYFSNLEGTQNQELFFQKILAQDLGSRARDGLKVYTDTIEEEEDQSIRFDFFAKNLIDIVLEKRFMELESFYIAIQTKTMSQRPCNIQFEDFKKIFNAKFPQKSQTQIELAFNTFVDSVLSDNTPLSIPIIKLLPIIIGDDIIQENSLKININLINSKQNIHQNNDSNDKQQNAFNQAGSGANIQQFNGQKQKQQLNSNLQNTNREQEFQKIQTIYDHITELLLLEETYKIILPIVQNEKKNETLNRSHEMFKQEFNKFPRDLAKKNYLQILHDFEPNKQSLKESLEFSWELFRKILSILTANNK